MVLAISLVLGLLLAWAGIGLIMIGLLVYRARLSVREEDQLFLDPSARHLEREQREVVTRLERLAPYLWGTFIVWVVVGLGTFGLWVWQQLR